MSVQETVTRIATLAGQVEGVKTAFEQIPRIISNAQVPAIVIFPGEATYDVTTLGEQSVLEDRIYRIVLFYAEAAFGTQGQQQIGIEPMFTRIRDYFLARPGLSLSGDNTNVIYDATMQGDAGFQIVDYPSGTDKTTSFAAIEFRLSCRETARILYQD